LLDSLLQEFLAVMSLLNKYPHLKTLLEEREQKRISASESPSVVQQVPSDRDKSPGKQTITNKKSRAPASASPTVKATDPPKASAEQLFADSREADNDNWLVFILQRARSDQQLRELKTWLEKTKPSKVLRSDGVGWISVIFSSAQLSSAPQDEDKVKTAWESVEGERTMETVNSLATKYCYRAGKWMHQVSTDYVDKVWKMLAIAMAYGELSPAITSIKVSPKSAQGTHDSSHVIIAHNSDYQDTVQVMKAENLLRNAGLLGDLNYKPDIFSHLGIYRNNKWGFRPSIYTSKMMKQDKNSKITFTGTGKWYKNTSKGLDIPVNVNLDKIIADISVPEPNLIADYNPADFKDEKTEQ